MLNNISRPDTPKGFVVASPSKFDPDYYFHWVRDAALVMAAVDKTTPDYSKKAKMFKDYIGLVQHHQSVFKLSNQGEPKFNTDGTSYQLPWGRPQNDGPALRALVLSRHALELLERGEESYVRSELYQGKIPAIGVIKRDLEYVSHNWEILTSIYGKRSKELISILAMFKELLFIQAQSWQEDLEMMPLLNGIKRRWIE